MIILEDIALRRGPRLLLDAASATLAPGDKVALIGANGSGKSSFFALLLGELSQDAGDIRGLSGLRISHMAQEVIASEESAADYVLAGDKAVHALLEDVKAAEAQGDFERAAGLHQALEDCSGYDAPRRAERLLSGLGFSPEQVTLPVTRFSGGWRIRLNLAQALMKPSDLLLLDEPTNHLDLDATLWLQSWLQRYPGTALIISHDRDFIDASSERIFRIDQQKLNQYTGGYSDYERQHAESLRQQQAAHERQQQRVDEIENFVRRFRAKASKAKQAQSRLKELERMERVAPARANSAFRFEFPDPQKTSDPLLGVDEARMGYGETPVLAGVSMALSPGDRIGLLGRNGAGKSTLLKSLIGKQALLGGRRTEGVHLRVGYYDQQQLEALDLAASPLLHLQRLTPDRREQEVLDFLGGFDFRGERAKASIAPLSGGEKARLALAIVVWQAPNLLVLDEPTNHLDIDMRHALEIALQGFAGALLIVSHDRHLLRNTVDQLILVHDGEVSDYPQDLASYERWILDRDQSAEQKPAPETASGSQNSKKTQRQSAADRRARLRPLTKALKATETQLDRVNDELATIQTQLSDGDLYSETRKGELTALLTEEGRLKTERDQLEDEWMQQQEALEALDADA